MSFDPKKSKVAIFHAFLKSDCKGGGERLVFDVRNYYDADLFVGGISLDTWGKHNADKDSFVKEVWKPSANLTYLHHDSKLPVWKKIKRQLFFLFSPKVNQLNSYDVVIFSGNIAFIMGRITNPKVKKVMYCHTPPRPFTDQLEARLKAHKPIFRPIMKWFANWVVAQYRSDCQKVDLVITNSQNTKNRLQKYVGIDSTVIFPAINTQKFKYISQGDYYVSYTRLEPLKRTQLIFEAFAQMPDKKLAIASSGPLAAWIKEQIKVRNLKNITYVGMVTDEELASLVGNCIAGIMIPVNEDAGITQCEIMSAGKPVIGVNEGGLKETVIDGKTGVLIPENPSIDDLKQAVKEMTPKVALSMKEDCIQQAMRFDSKVFFEKMNRELNNIDKEV
ncbi:MAG: glycosyltransferase [Patescibacteria group bacterium]